MLSFCESHYTYPLDVLLDGAGNNTDGSADVSKKCENKVKSLSVKSNQFAFVYYHKLQRELVDTVKSLFKQLDIHCGENYIKNILVEEAKRCRNFVGTHEYSIAKCCGGITEEELKANLKIVYEKHSELLQLEMKNWGL